MKGTKKMIDRIKLVLENVLETKIKSISEDLNIRELDMWDSVGHINLMVGVEEEFNIEITPEQAENIYRVQDIIDIINDMN